MDGSEYEDLVKTAVVEAKKLGIPREIVLDLIETLWDEEIKARFKWN